jgi:hypothetical protein
VTSVRGLFCTLVLAIFVMTAAVADAQGGGPNIRLTGATAQLNVIFQTGPKGTQKAPPVTPDSSGAVALPPGLLSPDKPHTRMIVYQCPDGVYVVAEGTPDPCPQHSRKLVGGFWWNTGGKVIIDLTAGTVTDTSETTSTSGASSSTGRGASSSGYVRVPTWNFDISGFGGANVFSNSSDDSASRPKIGFDFDAMFHPWQNYFGVGPFVGFVDTPNGAIEHFGSSGGSEGSSFGSYNVRRIDVPIGVRFQQNFGHFGISEEAGALPSFVKLVSRSCSSGSSGGTSCDSSTITDQTIVGYTYGIRLHYLFGNHWSAFAGWNRDGALKPYSGSSSSSSEDFQSNEGYGGITYSWGLR